MNIGTKLKIELIADGRFLGNCANVETAISVQRSSLKTAIHGEGLEIYEASKERFLNDWQGNENEPQIRQTIILMLSKKLTKNRIYEIINQVRPQPIKFI